MKLTILGSGTTSPHKDRTSSGYWLETSSGNILLDISPSAVYRMAAEGLPWHDLDAIWVSHFHLDHIGGLPPYLFGVKYARETIDRKKPLRIFGPKGLTKMVEKFSEAGDYQLFVQPFPLEFIEVEPLDQFQLAKGLSAAVISTPHTDESLAIHIRDGLGKTLVYSADTGFSEPLTAFARNVDIFILECMFLKNKPVKIHLELAEAVWMAKRAEARTTIFTHLDSSWDNVDFNAEISAYSSGLNIIQAKDGLSIEL